MPFEPRMQINEIKSELSVAYIRAVAARLGCSFDESGRQADNMGIDLTLRLEGKFPESDRRIVALDIQVKSTSSPLKYDPQGRGIILDGLSREVYENYSEVQRSPAGIIVLFVLPDNSNDWLCQDEERLLMRRCAYWVSLCGAEACTGDTKRIFIPESQIFCVDQLRDVIFMKLAKREELRYAN
jgi:hypothetical protein